MSKEAIVNPAEIIHYYETCEEHYAMLWHLNTHGAMHYGYWEKGTRNLKDALFAMNDLLAEAAQLDTSKRVLDAGCGVGGSSLYMARKYGCKAHGITLSAKHADFANQKARQQGLAHLASFGVADYTDTKLDAGSFDVVWAIESVCHANEKGDFLSEAYRLLKPGGRVVLADFFRNSATPDANAAYWLDNWAKTWAIPHFEYHEDFVDKARKVGFKLLRKENITRNIYRSALRLYLYFYPGLIWNHLLKLVGKHNDSHIENMWSAFYQFHGLRRGHWRYEMVVLEK